MNLIQPWAFTLQFLFPDAPNFRKDEFSKDKCLKQQKPVTKFATFPRNAKEGYILKSGRSFKYHLAQPSGCFQELLFTSTSLCEKIPYAKPALCTRGLFTFHVISQKLMIRVLSPIPNTEKIMKSQGPKPRGLYCFGVFRTGDKTRSTSF